MSPPCYTYIFWVVRSAFYSDVHLLGDSHVQRQRHGFPFYNILWRLYHSGKPLFSDVMGFHFIVAETVATLIYVYNCLYIYIYHTSPYHTITYPTYTINIYDWNDPYTFWTQSIDQSRFPFWLPWFLNEVNRWWLYTCVTIFWRLNRFLACETKILAVTPGTEYDVLVIDGTTDFSPSCRSATRVCVKGLGQKPSTSSSPYPKHSMKS